jgi:valyl-tRNA synthetase
VAPSAGDPAVLDAASVVLAAIRRAKTEAKLSPRAPVDAVVAAGPPEWLGHVSASAADIRDAGNVARLDLIEAPTVAVSVELPSAPAA